MFVPVTLVLVEWDQGPTRVSEGPSETRDNGHGDKGSVGVGVGTGYLFLPYTLHPGFPGSTPFCRQGRGVFACVWEG